MNRLITILKCDNLINGKDGSILHLCPHECYDDRIYNSGLDVSIMLFGVWVD